MLDLDHTLLNSSTYNELDQQTGEQIEAWHAKERGLPPPRKKPPPPTAAGSAGGADGGKDDTQALS